MGSVRLINAVTGTFMTVPESRLDEYLAAGHKPAAEPVPEQPAEEKPKAAKKKTKK